MSKKPTVIVAGGGIGGLSAALGLANKDCAVTVLEQADRFMPSIMIRRSM